MPKQTGSNERRKDKRYALQNAIVSMPQVSSLAIGTILDISRGGMGVRYPAQGEQLTSRFEIDILLTDTNYFITNIPVATVSDFELENQVPFSLFNERRCGLRFGALSVTQTTQLEHVFQDFTDDRITP